MIFFIRTREIKLAAIMTIYFYKCLHRASDVSNQKSIKIKLDIFEIVSRLLKIDFLNAGRKIRLGL